MTRKSEPTLVERIRVVHPKYAALLTRQAELIERQAAAQNAANPLNQEERKVLLGWVAQLPKPKPKPVVRHAGAVDLVGELLSPQPEEEINPPPPRPLWHGEKRHRELGAELESIAEALKLLAPELTKARREYSKLVWAKRGGNYKALAAKIADAAQRLGDVLLEHHEFVDCCRSDGVEWRFHKPVNVKPLGNVDEPHNALRELIESCVEQQGVGSLPTWRLPANIDLLT